jgi:type IV pilus assembly protein PilO
MSKGNVKLDGIKEKMSLFFEKVGALTKLQRLLICLATFAVLGGGYYYFFFMPRYDRLAKLQKNYQNQVKTLATYRKRASKILKYEKMMAAAREEFSLAMKALPDKRELPGLLTAISRAGSDAGLVFQLFKPENEINKDFYKQIPVAIKVEGRYHQITDFLFQIMHLNRIVNINSVYVKSRRAGKILEMSCRAVTYMFVERKGKSGKHKGRKRRKG